MASPKYQLQDVIKLISSEAESKIWFPAKSRSIDKVVEVYSTNDKLLTYGDAVDFILAGLRQLSPDDFVESVYQWDIVCDVYGAFIDKKPWYIKFAIDGDCLSQISFHPPEKPLKTVTGKTIF
ncbi:MAG: hypothetical protein A2Z20_08010 [Bdellovibrionales bacterium RBG_16_40_8]|nr:MAG: hypothetical protein A2Z20_08010 [Bdellovibrionales bacterium RBG_16_40_8]